MRMVRPLMLAACVLVLSLVAVALGGAAYFAPPEPGPTVAAIAVTGATPVTLLPRHGLVCADTDALTTVCRATVAGRTLTLTAERAAPTGIWRSSTWIISCRASYGERTAPCRGTWSPYAVVDGGALGLDGAAVIAARPAWLLPDRWASGEWLRAFVGLAALLALGAGVAALGAPLDHPLGRLALGAGVAVTTFVVAAPLLAIYLDALGILD